MRDKHHVLFNRQEWRLRPEATKIREHPSLIPSLPREVHEDLHQNCPAVPPLGYYALVRVAKLWYPSRNTLQSMDELTYAVGEAIQHPSAHEQERKLGNLVIEGINLQRPFIEDGLAIPDTRTIIDLKAAA